MKKLFVGLVLVLCLLLALNLSSTRRDYAILRQKYDALQEKEDALESLFQEIQQQNEDLLSTVNQITNQLEQIQQVQLDMEKNLEDLTTRTALPAAANTTTGPTNNPANAAAMVWVSQSGSRYHASSTCSNMKNPSQITLSAAAARGLTPCSRCF